MIHVLPDRLLRTILGYPWSLKSFRLLRTQYSVLSTPYAAMVQWMLLVSHGLGVVDMGIELLEL
jgi:hypothetical protein